MSTSASAGASASTTAPDPATPDAATLGAATTTVRVMLPQHLRTLSGAGRVVELAVVVADGAAPTQRAVLDALEAAYPTLRAAIRDPASGTRRPLVRFFAGGQDLSHEPPDAPLPAAVARGEEPYMVIGAMAGG
jgi:hypothetical protein